MKSYMVHPFLMIILGHLVVFVMLHLLKLVETSFNLDLFHVFFLVILVERKDINYFPFSNFSIFFSRDMIFHEHIFPYKSSSPSLFALPILLLLTCLLLLMFLISLPLFLPPPHLYFLFLLWPLGSLPGLPLFLLTFLISFVPQLLKSLLQLLSCINLNTSSRKLLILLGKRP